MEKLVIVFKYQGQLENGPARDYSDGLLVAEIKGLIQARGVEIVDSEKIRDGSIYASRVETDEPALENHTLIDVYIDIIDEQDMVAYIDLEGRESTLYDYVIDAIELGDPEITHFYVYGDPPLLRSIVGLEINPPF